MEGGSTGEDVEAEPGIIRRVVTIPCMRESLLYGISGGISIGLAHFLFTSNVSRASKLGFGGYILIMYGTWAVCRYNLAQEKFKAYRWQKAQQTEAAKIRLLDPKDV